jgi:formamidopyrimidine-DNA glycosylase
MPEGPEIRRAADKLKRVLAGQPALSVRFAADRFPALQASGKRLSGRLIESVEPQPLIRLAGKLVLGDSTLPSLS